MKGGYQIFNMNGISVETGGTVDGLYNLIESTYQKVALVTNTTDINGDIRNDEWAIDYTKSGEHTITTNNYIYTITADDVVTVKKNNE